VIRLPAGRRVGKLPPQRLVDHLSIVPIQNWAREQAGIENPSGTNAGRYWSGG
jgi:hypothetical protein